MMTFELTSFLILSNFPLLVPKFKKFGSIVYSNSEYVQKFSLTNRENHFLERKTHDLRSLLAGENGIYEVRKR